MNESKRRFIKALPLAALGGIAAKVDGHDARTIELKPNKRYVLKVDSELSQQEIDMKRW